MSQLQFIFFNLGAEDIYSPLEKELVLNKQEYRVPLADSIARIDFGMTDNYFVKMSIHHLSEVSQSVLENVSKEPNSIDFLNLAPEDKIISAKVGVLKDLYPLTIEFKIINLVMLEWLHKARAKSPNKKKRNN